ncbi:uncharacterized protein SPAPADRAFT_136251 [Spathaspora passalidarum NRRL Y-27907]|uniref:Uncharacterized protein n=1 Tax=Spathaspora passalidarum (strain NRRL Y-27907 / 11-Y1) TaxID=619300 RepID=G3AK67_SPAPN|nr:uncharacterized protein SPAPADRAFT_136251 [Spathaspora passalidarum NRRL Y-27907]EGW32879.1 hypothetical protein SPAPADRAFT_136251 [Spathaspora passalidarum NRRL Y-27907]
MKVSSLLVFTFILNICCGYQLYCRCDCNQNSIIKEIEKCGLCTREFCLSQDENLCVVAVNNNDENKNSKHENSEKEKENIIISCFQVESFKDSMIIYSFIFTILGLLLYAGYKTYIR